MAPLWCDLGLCSRTVVVIKLWRTSVFKAGCRGRDFPGTPGPPPAMARASLKAPTVPADSRRGRAASLVTTVTDRRLGASTFETESRACQSVTVCNPSLSPSPSRGAAATGALWPAGEPAASESRPSNLRMPGAPGSLTRSPSKLYQGTYDSDAMMSP